MSYENAPAMVAEWFQASACGMEGCVQVARVEQVLMRDSKNPDGPVLAFTVPEVRAFADGVKKGEFDELLR